MRAMHPNAMGDSPLVRTSSYFVVQPRFSVIWHALMEKKGSKVQSECVVMSVLSSSCRARPGRLCAKGEWTDSLPDDSIFLRESSTAKYALRTECIVWQRIKKNLRVLPKILSVASFIGCQLYRFLSVASFISFKILSVASFMPALQLYRLPKKRKFSMEWKGPHNCGVRQARLPAAARTRYKSRQNCKAPDRASPTQLEFMFRAAAAGWSPRRPTGPDRIRAKEK